MKVTGAAQGAPATRQVTREESGNMLLGDGRSVDMLSFQPREEMDSRVPIQHHRALGVPIGAQVGFELLNEAPE
jgi:hypothetical protein